MTSEMLTTPSASPLPLTGEKKTPPTSPPKPPLNLPLLGGDFYNSLSQRLKIF